MCCIFTFMEDKGCIGEGFGAVGQEEDMTEKIKKFLEEKGLDAVLVADGSNMRYLSGFTGAAGYLYMSARQQVILTDGRYTLQAKEEGNGFSVMGISPSQGYPEKLQRLLTEDGAGSLGFEDEVMVYGTVERLRAKLPVREWVPLGDALTSFRRVKSEQEIGRMAKAEAIGDEAFIYILGELRPGVTELEIAAKLEYYIKTHGAEDISFPPIVASGLHSSMPHAAPSHRKLEKGDFITLDFGCRYQGYCSDMTRTVVLGKADDRQKEIYRIVLESQAAGLSAVRAGISGSEADRIAREVIEKAGYGECFAHSLGHSAGLEIHEKPALSSKESAVLEPGMVVTVEPGIYVPGFGGVRIEDMVVVTEHGCRNLTHSAKGLIEL